MSTASPKAIVASMVVAAILCGGGRALAPIAHWGAILLTSLRIGWLLTSVLLHRLACVVGLLLSLIVGLANGHPASQVRAAPAVVIRQEACAHRRKLLTSRRGVPQRPPAIPFRVIAVRRAPRRTPHAARQLRHRQPPSTAPPSFI